MPQIVTVSLRVSGPPGAENALADHLHVPQANRFLGDQSYPFDYLDKEEAALEFWPLQGDFTLAIELTVFGMTEDGLTKAFLDASLLGLAIAVPDESSDRPFDYLLYLDGEILHCEIDEDEVVKEANVINPKSLRKTLRSLQNPVKRV